ncbi:MAG TPA: J domain-containing protein [Micavibrio sp.]|nr:J domain-containing protein [Micavibrio sp.]
MVYLILAAGLILAVFSLYRYLLKAPPREIKTLFLAAAAVGVGIAALFLTVTGKLPAAIAILTALWPIGASYLKMNRQQPSARQEPNLTLTAQEAYEVLGLKPGADEEEIKAAHLRLMKKVHPDQAGSDWLAKKINAARDRLLG